MTTNISLPRGTSDILPDQVDQWKRIENLTREICKNYGYEEIRTPIFEETELFARSMGQTSDVVQKQMLNLSPQNKEAQESSATFSLRPEGTASVVRAYIQNSLDKKEPLSKLFYLGPMFRGERPQKGRLRQFHQIGVEAIGPQSASPYLDAEVIALSIHLLKSFGVEDYKLIINTLGSADDKKRISQWLRDEIKPFLKDLSEYSQDRFERNVFRILDSKEKNDQQIIGRIDFSKSPLQEESRQYFQKVKGALDTLGIVYEESPSLVRGLDYYTHTVFEITSSLLGSQSALGAGGRYNNLVEQLGGNQVDAIGFALGVERILLTLKNKEEPQKNLQAFFIAMDEKAFEKAFQWLDVLRGQGVSADMSFKMSSMKSQMRQADKSAAQYVLILGDNELKGDFLTVKNMKTGEQKEISIKNSDYSKLLNVLRERE